MQFHSFSFFLLLFDKLYPNTASIFFFLYLTSDSHSICFPSYTFCIFSTKCLYGIVIRCVVLFGLSLLSFRNYLSSTPPRWQHISLRCDVTEMKEGSIFSFFQIDLRNLNLQILIGQNIRQSTSTTCFYYIFYPLSLILRLLMYLFHHYSNFVTPMKYAVNNE